MNTIEPVIAFIDERLNQFERFNHDRFGGERQVKARIDELEMIRTLCTGLIAQDKLLKDAMGVNVA